MNKIAKFKQKHQGLDIPRYIMKYDDKYIDKHSDGCGSKWTEWIVPDKPIGLDISSLCRCHDLEYTYIAKVFNSSLWRGKKSVAMALAKSARIWADLRFRRNIIILANDQYEINKKVGVRSVFFFMSRKWQAKRRWRTHLEIADSYHYFVKKYGWTALERMLKIQDVV